MQAKLGKLAAMAALGLTLAACGGEPRLQPFLEKSGPDEFGIVPTKPLQEPPSYSELPPPTPGAGNITDPTPNADAVVALGGSGAALSREGVDGGIVNHASRYGRDPAIRTALAEEDLRFRKRNSGRILDRLLGRNVYLKSYRRQRLDSYAELERLRRAGVLTPTAPPKGIQSE